MKTYIKPNVDFSSFCEEDVLMSSSIWGDHNTENFDPDWIKGEE